MIRPGEADPCAAQDVQRPERDQEARQAGLDPEISVERADAEREGEGQDDRQRWRDAPLDDEQAEQEAGRSDRRADDRSNSPPIISSETAAPRIPTCAAISR